MPKIKYRDVSDALQAIESRLDSAREHIHTALSQVRLLQQRHKPKQRSLWRYATKCDKARRLT